MFKHKFINYPSFELDDKIIRNILLKISKLCIKKQKGILNIIFVDKNTIKGLNQKYRNKDIETDVLSFHYFDDFENLKKNDIGGEIILYEDLLKEQGKIYGLGEEKEFYKLFIHSVLHIIGYDHESDEDFQEMNNLENEIWNKLFEKIK